MKEKCLNKLLGKKYKIIAKEPGDEKNHLVIGENKEIEYDKKFISIEPNNYVGGLYIESLVSIKPWQQHNI